MSSFWVQSQQTQKPSGLPKQKSYLQSERGLTGVDGAKSTAAYKASLPDLGAISDESALFRAQANRRAGKTIPE